ncbi:MAG TPA: hypothetical protein VGG62_02325 [Terracidiphilus sp.]|jgi:hypothetical protein
MNRISPILLGMSLALAGGFVATAQDATPTPPKVIQITREWIKPGRAGMAHDQSEAAFVAALTRGKVQGHYVALNSMSGKSRALYITRYPSFEAWEKDNKAVDKNAELSSELDRAEAADGELLDGLDQAVATYNEELSYHPRPDLSHARYYEITVFHVRPGHTKEWYEVSKMYRDVCDKAGLKAHWGMYEVAYGLEGGTFIALTHRESMAEIDESFADSKKFMEAVGGPEGMSKLDALYGQAVDSSHSELFSINPKQSYAEEAWIKADPDFWKPNAKTPQAAAAKPAAQADAASKPASR